MEGLTEAWQSFYAKIAEHPNLELTFGIFVLLTVAAVSNFVVKHALIRVIVKGLDALQLEEDKRVMKSTIIARLANIIPALVLYFGVHRVPQMPEVVITVVHNVVNAFIVLTIALAINGSLTLANLVYERKYDAARKPIKGYIQVFKIAVYVIAAILMIATLIDRSPLILLSGLGAMAAVLLLVFQDTLLSLVASMQISSNDIIRVGDWVEMPHLSADGEVIDIALHTVKVQNWDRTICSIPTRRFITDGFKNWRGMQESGGRRIMRNILLDQQSIGFLSADEKKGLQRFRLLHDYMAEKQQEIDAWNAELKEAGKEPVNTRRITNIGTFRAYVRRYLQSHQGIHQDMLVMVRQLSPTSEGLPLQVYAFTNTTEWAKYEGIQSDIFDHLLAILPEFGLRVFQSPSGRDVRELGQLLGENGITRDQNGTD
ncbi:MULTISPECIES: mechanosensitive ion channel family protein [Gammaproteobacteria]|uniref:mechanosensitive ion channel family protein n=1 Tax=Gammaproteobacteria TaxID=1236 RepID=UPI000DD0513D|nr:MULTISPECIES: mechanosensitive ion channel family protein [Gammaproteobacteria]RTE86763.1 mechanosensitive ion channel family protein [Aliidiomarina sp. B3213]TCZ90683.1 mechanosensitive ion channel family protein [Lysobacter sp. N42]